jgi:ubiquinone/menaquinone biosynthesis C-methylase UbiE
MQSFRRFAGTDQHAQVIEKWKTRQSSNFQYFGLAESDEWTRAFWEKGGRYQRLFEQLSIARVVEIACGQGRHSLRIVDRCEQLWLVDSSVDALAVARERFSPYRHAEIILTPDGLSLPGIADGAASTVFSFDAMVHFELLTVACYVFESARVLMPGGRGLFHHSNYAGNPTGHVDDNPGWRNFMTTGIMAHLLSRAGLVVREQVTWDRSSPQGDALTLFEKPRAG